MLFQMRDSTRRACVFQEENLGTSARIERWCYRDNSYYSIPIFLLILVKKKLNLIIFVWTQ